VNSAYKIYVAGVGGQGIIRISTIIGEAAMKKGLNAVMSELHGMAERGGIVTSEVKVGNASSALIQKGNADLLLALEPVEALRSLDKVGPNTTAIVNSVPIIPFTVSLGISSYPEVSQIIAELRDKVANIFVLDALDLARKAGDLITVNVVMLGAAAAIPGFPVGKELLLASMKQTFPASTIEVNAAAFESGYETILAEMQRERLRNRLRR
jgi:indolepyruvate ferredoxin oxidoreductase beta subunit